MDGATRLRKAGDMLAEAETAGDRVKALTATIRAYEAGLADLRREIRTLTLERRRFEAQLFDEDEDLSALFALMQAASRQTEVRALLHPGSAPETIRAGMLARELLPSLQLRADDLRQGLQAIDETEALIAEGRATLETGLTGVREARLALAAALAERTDLPPRVATDDAAMDALIDSAATLSALIDNFSTTRDASSRGGGSPWTPPIDGVMTKEFQPGDAHPGWEITAGPAALVTAPANATVRFSREIANNGTVILLEADGGYLIVLGNLGASLVTADEVVGRGAPVGYLRAIGPAAQDKLNGGEQESSLALTETLYIEIRRDGVPVDPAEVLTLTQE